MMTVVFELDDLNYIRFRDLIFERIGILYNSSKREMLEHALWSALENKSWDSLNDFYSLLKSAPTTGPDWAVLINQLTIGETYFFRTIEHFNILQKHILPDLMQKRQISRHLRLWSAGCASGEEAYSIAILLHETIPHIETWNVSILASDVNLARLEQGRQAIFRSWSFRQEKPGLSQNYFEKQGEEYHLMPNVRHLVHFSYLNLVEDNYPSAATLTMNMDVIFWRNTAIYMPYDVNQKIAEKLFACLVPGGWLIVGAHETNDTLFKDFTPCTFSRFTVYQRPAVVKKPLPLAAPVQPPVFYHLQAVPPSRPLPPEKAPQPQEEKQEKSALECIQAGRALMEQKQTEAALNQFEKALLLDPTHAGEGHYFIAKIHAGQRQLETALKSCRQAVESSPLMAEAHYLLGTILLELNETEQAIEQFKKTLYLSPDIVLAHVSLAALYKQTGRPKDASRHRANAVRLTAHLPASTILPGSDDLSAGQLLDMLRMDQITSEKSEPRADEH